MNVPHAPAATPSATAGHGLLPPLPSDRRGRLRNGARPGDFLSVPRCGARTRCGGTCRQPAMTNGRCRVHGGLSTGPRTAQGRTLMAEGRAAVRRLRTLRFRTSPTARHGLLSSISVGAVPRGRPQAGDGWPRGAAPTIRSAIRVHLRSSAVENSSTAGHGVLPSKPSRTQRLLLGSTALVVSLRPAAVTAGHGVLSPESPRLPSTPPAAIFPAIR